MKKSLLLTTLTSLAALPLLAQSEADVQLPAMTVYSPQVANQDPVGTFAMPVSALRFDPRADVQSRNLAEGQSDISIRGGIFENTGFKLGALGLYDPQTGHYLAEIPVAPIMLSAPEVLTGTDNAVAGFNANVGTIQYGWREIKTQGYASIAAGEHEANRQEAYQGYSRKLSGFGKVGVDLAFARSESSGAIEFGDHYFQRYNGRVQLVSALGQTDLVAGYQGKFFGWPNMYTPFGVKETENLQTVLFALNHRKDFANGDFLQVGSFWRRNRDDYEYNRFIPGQYNLYKHTTYVYGFAAEGRSSFGLQNFALNSAAHAMFDRINSTSLTFGPFNTRNYYKLTLLPEISWNGEGSSRLSLKAGASFDDTNRDKSAVSPVVEISRTTRSENSLSRLYASYGESSQVASYTALKSNPKGGLFRGNQTLGRTTSRNLEVGNDLTLQNWKFHGAVFAREDLDLVDWTYTKDKVNPSATPARTANAMDVSTAGFEFSATRSWRKFDLVVGYTGLRKDPDYRSAVIDASFYAMNFPRHRLTLAAIARLGGGVEVRLDNEARLQKANTLRHGSGDEYFLSSLGLAWRPSFVPALCISAQVDNLWDSKFEEVPAVPASPRQSSVSVAYTW